MKTVSISGSLRANVGKKDAKALRAAGEVPCVLYGGKEQIHFSVPRKQFKSLIYTPDVHTVEVSIGDKKYNAILQETQFHVLTDELIHVDLLELVEGKPVTMNIPVRTSGAAPGVRAGGRLVKKLKYVKLTGLIENMPDAVTIAIDNMNIGDTVRVGDVNIDGITFGNPANVSLIAVQTTRVAANVGDAEGEEGEGEETAEGAPAAEGEASKEPAKEEAK